MIEKMKESDLILINAKGTEGKVDISILNDFEHALFSGSLLQQPYRNSQSQKTVLQYVGLMTFLSLFAMQPTFCKLMMKST